MTAIASPTSNYAAAIERYGLTSARGGGETTQETPAPSQEGTNPYTGSRQNDGYSSFGGSVLRNALTGAAMGGIASFALGPVTLPVGLAAGAALGAASALIRHPRVSAAVGDGMKAAAAGATGGAVVGTISPLGPVGGAVAGGVGGFLTGTVSGMLKNTSGGKHSIEAQTTFMGRVKQGAKLGAVSGAVVGAGAGLMMGGITMPVGAAWGALIGGAGGAIYGAVSGVTDGLTGAKGMRLFGGGKDEGGLPKIGSGSGDPATDPPVGQNPNQVVQQEPVCP